MRILDFFVNLFMTNILFNLHTWRGHLKNWIQRKHALNDLLDCQYGFIRAGHGIFSLVRFLRVFLPLCLIPKRIYVYSPIFEHFDFCMSITRCNSLMCRSICKFFQAVDAAAMFLECLWYTIFQNNKKNSNRFLNRVIFCKTTFPIAGLSRLASAKWGVPSSGVL